MAWHSGNGAGVPAGQRRGTPQESSHVMISRSPASGPEVNGACAKATTQICTHTRPSAATSAVPGPELLAAGPVQPADLAHSSQSGGRAARTIGIS